MQLEIGKSYNEINQYNDAIRILSEVLKKDPKNKEAYFERAYSYFETNNLELALDDYIKADMHPTHINNMLVNFIDYLEYQKGVIEGTLQGTLDASIEFVPSLLSTIRGMSVGLWAFMSDPIGMSKEMVDCSCALFSHLKECVSKEALQAVIPEIKICLEKWNILQEREKGYYIGHTIAQLGVDALFVGSGVKAIKLWRKLKRANAIWTLEQASLSPISRQEIIRASQRFFEEREAFKRGCKLHLGQQEKHILGANNFIEGTSELTISIERLEKITAPRIGTGVPSRACFGEVGYRELVDFGEEIGVHLTDPSKGLVVRTKTSFGEIHYKIDGSYHVVPVHPDKLAKLVK